MMRVCSDLLYDFFTLQRDYNKNLSEFQKEYVKLFL